MPLFDEIPCIDNSCKYRGETKRRLGTRRKEHKRAVENLQIAKSCVAAHVADTNHSVDWNNVKILRIEPNTQLRKIKEGILIQSDQNTYNKQYGDQFRQSAVHML